MNILPWKIVHLDLATPLPSLSPESGYDGYYLVFWWRNLALGRYLLHKEQLPLPSTALYSLALQQIAPGIRLRLGDDWETIINDASGLQQLEKLLTPPETLPTVSVILCTRDRPEALKTCLRSLQNLSTPPHEIIVVDNAPRTTATQELVAQMPEIKYVCEPKPGLSIARNTGIEHSSGEIIAFTDDDVTVHQDWTLRLAQSFLDPNIFAVTGVVIPSELETEAQVIFEIGHGGLSGEYRPLIFDRDFFTNHQAKSVPVWKIGAGANMAFRRNIFDKIGYFDKRLGAGASGCSEDSELWYRILAQGLSCHREPTAVVYHCHRRSRESLNRQMYQYMRGHISALFLQFFKYKHWGNLRRAIFLSLHYLGLFGGRIVRGEELKHQTTIAEFLGYLAGFSIAFKYLFTSSDS